MMQAISQIPSSTANWKNSNNNSSNNTVGSVDSEPTSNLDTTRHRSPSSPTSTFSSSLADRHGSENAGAGGAAGGMGMEEWDSMFPNGDGALLPWIMGEADDLGMGLKHFLQSANPNVVEFEGNAGLGVVDQSSHPYQSPIVGSDLGFPGSILPNSSSNLPASGFGFSISHPQLFDEKPQILNPQLMMMNSQQAQSITNPSFFMPPIGYNCHQLEQHLLQQPQAKRHNPGVVFDNNLLQKTQFLNHQRQQQQFLQQQSAMGLAIPRQISNQKPMIQEQVIKDQLLKAADQIQTGNFSLAQEILARLNHQLSIPSKLPLVRAALYVKEALQMLLMSNPVASSPPKTLTPFDIVHKMNAYKAFSEVSPVPQFVNFTFTQAILEALDDEADCIHVIDFDIGCGALWASLIQELPLRKRGAPSLKITAIAPLSTSHPFELTLVRENLVQFANDIGVSLEVQVVNLDLFDPSSPIPNVKTSENESIAVSIPIWATSYRPSILPSILRFIKQRSPKIVVSLDRGFDRYDTPFPQHLIHTLESCTNFLESLDGVNITSEIVTKVEKFFVQPRIENTVLGRVHAPDKMPHWKTLFSSAGLSPLQFSNFTETQADYVVKRTPGRGFHVEKRQASLVLSWQRREVVAVSAWRC